MGYLSFAGAEAVAGNASESPQEMVIPCAGTIKDFRVNLQVQPGGPGGANVRVFTVRKNGADTSLSVSFDSSDFHESDSGSVSVSQGDVICVKHTVTGSPASSEAAIALTFTPSTRGNFIIGTSRGGHHLTSTRFEVPQAPLRKIGLQANGNEQVCGVFDIKGITVDLTIAPGSGNSFTYHPAVDGSTVGSALVISGGATSGSQSHSTAISAGSALATKVTPASGPADADTTISYIGFIDDPAPPAPDVSAMMMGANF